MGNYAFNLSHALNILVYLKTHGTTHWDVLKEAMEDFGMSHEETDHACDHLEWDEHPQNPEGIRYMRRHGNLAKTDKMHAFLTFGGLQDTVTPEPPPPLPVSSEVTEVTEAIRNAMCREDPVCPTHDLSLARALIEMHKTPCAMKVVAEANPSLDMGMYEAMINKALSQLSLAEQN